MAIQRYKIFVFKDEPYLFTVDYLVDIVFENFDVPIQFKTRTISFSAIKMFILKIIVLKSGFKKYYTNIILILVFIIIGPFFFINY